jgi:hypothetical protein
MRVSHIVAINSVQYGEKRDAATHDGVDSAGFFEQSFRDGPKDQTWNLEIPGSRFQRAPE